MSNKEWKCVKCGHIMDKKHPHCPICGAGSDFIKEIDKSEGGVKFAQEHKIPELLTGLSKEYVDKIRGCFQAECTEAGMYLAMSRQAFREGYPEIGVTLKQIAEEEAVHAARFCEILGENVSSSTEKNLMAVINGEKGACSLRYEIASEAKRLNLDAVHDSVHDISKDEARHGLAAVGLLKRYFNKSL